MKDLITDFISNGLTESAKESAPPQAVVKAQPPKVFSEEPKLSVVPELTNEQAVKLFGKDAASVYMAARQRIREKSYPNDA